MVNNNDTMENFNSLYNHIYNFLYKYHNKYKSKLYDKDNDNENEDDIHDKNLFDEKINYKVKKLYLSRHIEKFIKAN